MHHSSDIDALMRQLDQVAARIEELRHLYDQDIRLYHARIDVRLAELSNKVAELESVVEDIDAGTVTEKLAASILQDLKAQGDAAYSLLLANMNARQEDVAGEQ